MGVWFGFMLETAEVTWGCCSYCWAKCLGGFHNMLCVLQAPSPPRASGLWTSGNGYTNMPGWEKQGCGLTVPQFLCGDCPPTSPCPTVSFSAVHWGELLCIWAGRREFGWAAGAEEVQPCALTPCLALRSLCACPCLQAGSVLQRFPGKLPSAIK